MSLTSSGVTSPDPPARRDLASILQRVTAAVEAYDDDVTVTVEPIEITVKPEDAARVNEAMHHGNAVTFTAPKSRLSGHARRRQVPRQRSRERRPGARRASSSSRTSSADPGESGPSDEPEPPATTKSPPRPLATARGHGTGRRTSHAGQA